MKTITVMVNDDVYKELEYHARWMNVPVDVWVSMKMPMLAAASPTKIEKFVGDKVTLEEARDKLREWIKTKPVGYRFALGVALKEADVRTDGRWLGREIAKAPEMLGRPLKVEVENVSRFYTILE